MAEKESEHAPFDVFCPECNIQVEARVIAIVGHGFESEAKNPEDQVDAPFNPPNSWL